MFSNRISGAAISYTVNYTDSTSGRACGVAIVPPSACRSGACSHTLQASTSPCFNSSGITVTVYATNALGNGQTSAPITIGMYIAFIIHSQNYLILLCVDPYMRLGYTRVYKRALLHLCATISRQRLIMYKSLNSKLASKGMHACIEIIE